MESSTSGGGLPCLLKLHALVSELASHVACSQVLSGVAGLVGGALSMAAGEYISVYSQKDSRDAG